MLRLRSMRALFIIALSLAACSSEVGDNPSDVDAGTDAAPGGDAAPAAAPELYPTDRTLSPITPYVADRLAAIATSMSRSDDLFAKVGASATVSLNFMHCFAGDQVDLDGRDELAATVEHFAAGDAAGTTPYERESLSATVGWSAGAAIDGDPSPMEQEIAAISPRYAVVMYGTNDIQLGDIDAYGDNMLTLTDQLIAAGVIPILTGIMPRDDDADADAEVPRYNAVIRGVAQSRQVPFIDFHRELAPLPDHGLGGDGIHPSVYRPDGTSRACVFTPEGLEHGYNIRNLLTVQTLDRLRRVISAGETAPDSPRASLSGSGRHDDPFVAPSLPFVHVANTRESIVREVDSYPGCNADQDESGAEYVYRFELAEAATVRLLVADRGVTDVDIHLMSGGTTGDDCVARDHRVVVADLAAGIHYVVVDSFTSGSTPQEGEYLFAILEEAP